MSAKYKSPSFLLPNEINTNTNPLNTDGNPATGTGINSLYSMDFDSSSSDYIDIGTISSLNTSQNFSISLWFNENLRKYTGTLFSSGTGTGNLISVSSRNGVLNIYVGSSGYIPITSVSLNTWYHVVLTVENTTAKVYINNGSPTTNTVGSINSSSGNLAKIGDLSFASGYYFDGKIDEVAIFNRALNTTEISALYDGSGSNIRPSNLMATDLGPIAYYPLGEQAQNSGYLSATGNEWQFPNGVLQDYVMDFDGSNRINCGTSSLGITNAITVSAWVKIPSTTPNSVQPIVCERDNTIGNNWSLRYRGGGYNKYYFIAWNTNGNTVSAPSAGITPNVDEWQHVVGVYDGSSTGRSYVYVNGVWRGTSQPPTGSGINSTSSVAPSIGGFQDLSAFVGSISNVQVFNTVLPLTGTNSIQTLYNNGSPLVDMSGFTSLTNWWKLNADSVYTPSVASYSAALDFGGTDYVDCGVVSAVENVSSFSMSVWVYPSNGNLKSVIGNWGNPYVGVEIGTSSGAVYFTVDSDTVGSSYGATPSGLSNNNWAHLVLVFDGSGSGNSGRLKGYINGVEQTLSYTGTIPATTAAPNRAFRIGDQHVGNGLIGNISNAAIFDSALTSTQVSTLFNFGTPETNISFSPISWWKLDNLTTGILDSGSASNNGTNNGATDISSGVAVIPSWKIPDASGTSNGVSTTLPSTALQQSDLQFDSPYSNYSLSFDGTGDYIDLGTSVLFDSTKGFSFSTWVNLNSYSQSYPSLARIVTDQTDDFIIGLSNANPSGDYRGVNFGSPSQFARGKTAGDISGDFIGTWKHVCLTFDGVDRSALSSYKIYVDGSSVSLVSAGAFGTPSGSVNSLGTGGFSTRDVNGKLDETAIFNTELTSSQVLEIYNNGRPKDLTTFSGTAPISWWRLGENAYFNDVPAFTVPNSITGAPNGTGSGTITTMISADAPGTYANGIGTNLDILDRVGDAPLSTSNSQSYNMIPSDISPYVPKYVGDQIANNFSMSFDSASSDYIDTNYILDVTSDFSVSTWIKIDGDSNHNILGTREQTTSASVSKGFTLLLNSSKQIWARIFTTTSSITQVNAGVIQVGQWFNVVATYVASTKTLKIYRNGIEMGSVTGTSAGVTSPDNLSISRVGIGGIYGYFDGEIDEVAIFDKALTADQVNFDLYQPSLPAGSNKTADIAKNPNLPTPVAWYRMGD